MRGISKYDSLKYQFASIGKEPLNNNSLADNMIFCMHENENFIYYGSQNSGIISFNKKTKQYKAFNISNTSSIVDNSIYGITEDKQGNIWMASWSGLMLFTPRTQSITSFVDKNNLQTLRLYTVHKMLHADSLIYYRKLWQHLFFVKRQEMEALQGYHPMAATEKSNWAGMCMKTTKKFSGWLPRVMA